MYDQLLETGHSVMIISIVIDCIVLNAYADYAA